jgi:glycosyltransferase involved in cell wall biosynthesis
VTAKLWIDVEDLFEYARSNPRPSGIQRLAFEIYKALQARPDACEFVRFVRHDTPRNSFQAVPWVDITSLFAELTESAPELTQPLPDVTSTHPPSRQFIRKLVHRLPPSLRMPMIDSMLLQTAALRAWLRLFDALARGIIFRLSKPFRLLRTLSSRKPGAKTGKLIGQGALAPSPLDIFGRDSAPGDILLVLGSPWSHPDYAKLIHMQRSRGLRFALLVYDLIPIRRPEWCDRGLVRVFRAWFDSVFPLCDDVFAISQATAHDVELYTRERGIELSGPVTPIPIGTSFGATDIPVPAPRTRRLPEPGTYALIVSTIEARKNHILLFRVWRRMLEEMPHVQVPTLVFAGRIGWLVDDLMRQIANTSNLNGKLLLIENPTDVELAALYEGCQFTMFPSFFEGWGLPVTESLALGKPCLTSDRTSLPEAGGNLTRRFDPDNLHDAYRAIREVIEDPKDLKRWEARVRREFEPVSWSTTAEALLAGLNHPSATPSYADVDHELEHEDYRDEFRSEPRRKQYLAQ